MEPAAEWISIDKLKPWEENPRRNEEAIKKVAESIQRFGFASPIIARKEDGQIIAGHTRYAASLDLGLSDVPVRFMDLDPADSRLLALADNRIGEIADWDDEKLSGILETLREEGSDITGLGWSDDELNDLLGDLALDDKPPAATDYEDLDNRQYQPGRLFTDGEVVDLGLGRIHCGDCIEQMKKMEESSIDAVICDPPYQINFMGSATGWDKEFDSDEWSRQCLRVLKPGGHLIAFAATRTIHKIMVSVEKAGFEIRDLLSWLYFSGFPKSMNISKQIDKMAGVEREVVGSRITGAALSGEYKKTESTFAASGTNIIDITKPATPDAIKWDGWGTGLKPAQEPAVLARKPMEKGLSITANVLKHSTGSLNIDKSRFGYGDPCWVGPNEVPKEQNYALMGANKNGLIHGMAAERSELIYTPSGGRWPANIYQCAKPSRSERDQGLEDFEPIKGHEAVNRKEGSAGFDNPRAGSGRTASEVKNYHPTVKPVKLMDWLVGLVTPLDGVVLDTFGGSGTTGLAAQAAGYRWIVMEKSPDYCSLIHGRIEGYINGTT